MIDQNTTPIADTSKTYFLLYHPKSYWLIDGQYHRLLWIMDKEYYRASNPEQTAGAELIMSHCKFYDAMKTAMERISWRGLWEKDVTIVVNDFPILECIYKPPQEKNEDVL